MNSDLRTKSACLFLCTLLSRCVTCSVRRSFTRVVLSCIPLAKHSAWLLAGTPWIIVACGMYVREKPYEKLRNIILKPNGYFIPRKFSVGLVEGYGNVGYGQFRHSYNMRQICEHASLGPLRWCCLNRRETTSTARWVGPSCELCFQHDFVLEVSNMVFLDTLPFSCS